jgi:large subunit ribosomal protein L6
MSRIGNKLIDVPNGVNIEVKPDEVLVTGPKGTLSTPVYPGITIAIEENKLKVGRTSEEKQVKSRHGLIRSLLQNNINGITAGFVRKLELHGVGYRATKKGDNLVMNLGYSHEVVIEVPGDLIVECPEPTKVSVTGIDKQRVGQMASDIRSKKPPEPYKGKGIRYEGEKVKRKAGKAGKK